MSIQRDQLLYRGCTPIVETAYNVESDRSAAEAIILALADAVGVDPTELPPLFEYVDPDALNALLGPSDSATDRTALLSFRVDTWTVFVRSDGRICVCDSTQPSDPKPVFEAQTT